jgi:hypothetical protein
MIDELKKWKFDDTYTGEETENIQDDEDGREVIEREREELKSLVKSDQWDIAVSRNTRRASGFKWPCRQRRRNL